MDVRFHPVNQIPVITPSGIIRRVWMWIPGKDEGDIEHSQASNEGSIPFTRSISGTRYPLPLLPAL